MEVLNSHFVILVCILATGPVQYTECAEWVLDDAVHISADTVGSQSLVGFENPQGQGLSGKCVKLRDCYPLLYLTERLEKGDSSQTNSDLIAYILETSDICQPAEYLGEPTNSSSIIPGSVYIWCRTGFQKQSSSTPLVKPSVSTIGSKNESENDSCGQMKYARLSEPEERVVGGSEITYGDAPYAVAIVFNGKQVCGGSIIDSHHVLTAAHCVAHLKADVLEDLRLFIGDHDLKDMADVEHQERNVSKIIYHKEFSSDLLEDDIAMIKVSEPIQFTSTVSPVCLYDGTYSVDDGTTNGKLIGWGQLEDDGDRPATPRSAHLRIWKPEECEDVYDGIVPEDILEKILCGGGFQDAESSACEGDSGGPLTITRNMRQVQVGIVSFGIKCGLYPSVFTKVSEYKSWINRHRAIKLVNE